MFPSNCDYSILLKFALLLSTLCRTLIYFARGSSRFSRNVASNLLKMISRILFHGCRLSSFFGHRSFLSDIDSRSEESRVLFCIRFIPHLYSLLTAFEDPRQATRVAQLLHAAGCPFSVPQPSIHSFTDSSKEEYFDKHFPTFYNGRQIFLELADKIHRTPAEIRRL